MKWLLGWGEVVGVGSWKNDDGERGGNNCDDDDDGVVEIMIVVIFLEFCQPLLLLVLFYKTTQGAIRILITSKCLGHIDHLG